MARETPIDRIYRRVSSSIWADERFRKLSGPKPNAQTLWFHLMFGEQTGIVPGLFKIGEVSFADQLGWTIQGFRKAWNEVEANGLAQADWKARLVWIPNAIRHNPPASPKVVLHWRWAWGLLPECKLRDEAQEFLKGFLQGYSEPFLKAYRVVIGEASANDYGESEAVAVAVTELEDPLTPQAGDSGLRPFSRASGTNPRALGTNPRALAKKKAEHKRRIAQEEQANPKSPEQIDAEDRAAVEAELDHG